MSYEIMKCLMLLEYVKFTLKYLDSSKRKTIANFKGPFPRHRLLQCCRFPAVQTMSVNFSLFVSRASPINHTPLSSRGITSIRICYRISSSMAIDFALEGLVFVMTAMMAPCKTTGPSDSTQHKLKRHGTNPQIPANHAAGRVTIRGGNLPHFYTEFNLAKNSTVYFFFPIISLTWLSVPVRVQCYFFVCFLRQVGYNGIWKERSESWLAGGSEAQRQCRTDILRDAQQFQFSAEINTTRERQLQHSILIFRFFLSDRNLPTWIGSTSSSETSEAVLPRGERSG